MKKLIKLFFSTVRTSGKPTGIGEIISSKVWNEKANKMIFSAVRTSGKPNRIAGQQ
jgi:hypothetical protein